MGESDYWSGNRDALLGLLDPGEELRLSGDVRHAYGDSGIAIYSERRFDRFWVFCTRTWPRKIVFGVIFAPVLLYLALDGLGSSGTVLDRLIGGRTCKGVEGSLARQAQQALSALWGRAANQYILSDRRLILARRSINWRGPEKVREVLSLPSADIAGARRRPRGLLRRRVELRFVDESSIVLALPVLASGVGQSFNPRLKRFVASLTY